MKILKGLNKGLHKKKIFRTGYFFLILCLMFTWSCSKGGKSMLKRSDVALADKWNVEKMYPSLEDWYKDLNLIKKKKDWQTLELYKNKLQESSDNLSKTLKISFDLQRSLEKLYTYSHLIMDEDLGNDKAKEAFGIIQATFTDFKEKTAWIEPEILQMPKTVFSAYLNDPVLSEYKIYLENLYRLKNYTLPPREEEILARLSNVFQTPYRTFSSFDNADLTFDKVKDSKGNLLDLTHGKYSLYLHNKDRVLRKNVFETYHSRFLNFENTLCELISGEVRNHYFVAKTRGFDSCLEAALYPNNIDLSVYKNLIATVRANIKTLHKYVAMKKKLLKLDKLAPYDLYAPVVELDVKMNLDEAKKTVIGSVAVLGEKYQSVLKKGLLTDRWVDFYETARKRSGAYSSGCYDSMPYILMNYYGNLNDVNTLAHEAGHSMHSYLSHENQPYQYSSYSIFVAEVASTFNEQLLADHLSKKMCHDDERAMLISDFLDRIHATFFRQTLFAEFELKIHELIEKDQPLTPGLLKQIYHQLYVDYYGPDMLLDNKIDIEWARIPHFYYNFYVYQYATGISAAVYLFDLVKKDKKNALPYLKFLESGCSDYPLNILKKAGVDLTKPDAIEALLKHFDQLQDQLLEILSNEEK